MTGLPRNSAALLMGVASAVASALASAQTADDSTSAPARTLPRVVISADRPDVYKADVATSLRTDTLLRDEPTSITVVTRKSIEDLNMQNLADVVRYVPGIG